MILLFVLFINVVSSQSTFSKLDSILDRTPLDSVPHYLELQQKMVSNSSENFTHLLNRSSYYRSINDYDSSLYFINLAAKVGNKQSQKGIIAQRKGFIYSDKHEYQASKRNYLRALSYFSDTLSKASVSYALHNVYEKIGQQDSSWIYLQAARKLYTEINCKNKDFGTVINSIGINYLHQAKYDSAYYYFLESLTIYEAHRDVYNIARTKDLIGTLFYYQTNYEKAIDYYQQSFNAYKELNDIRAQAARMSNIGSVYKVIRKLDSANHYYNQVYNIAIANNFNYLESVSLSNMAAIDADNGDYKSAINKQERSIKIDEKNNDKEGLANGYLNLGDFYSATGVNKLAVKKYNKSLVLSESIGRVEIIKEVYRKLSTVYEDWKNDSALYYYKEYTIIKDSIGSLELKERIEKLNIEYRNKIEAAENIQLKLEIDKNQKQLTINKQSLALANVKKNYIYALATLIVILLSFFTYVFYSRNRNSKKALSLSKLTIKQKSLEKQIITDRLENTQRTIVDKNKTIEKFEKYINSPEASEQLLKNLSTDKDWAKFIIDFELLYPNYFNSIVLIDENKLTKNDFRIAALSHLKLSNKEIAEVLSITLSGVKIAKNRLNSKVKKEL